MTRSANGERSRQRHGLVLHPGQRGKPQGHVNVGGHQHTRLVEGTEQRRCAQDNPHVEPIELRPERGHAAGPLPSSTSVSPSTSSREGRQAKTPQGVPSTTGVSGPSMPRTNR